MKTWSPSKFTILVERKRKNINLINKMTVVIRAFQVRVNVFCIVNFRYSDIRCSDVLVLTATNNVHHPNQSVVLAIKISIHMEPVLPTIFSFRSSLARTKRSSKNRKWTKVLSGRCTSSKHLLWLNNTKEGIDFMLVLASVQFILIFCVIAFGACLFKGICFIEHRAKDKRYGHALCLFI